MSEETKLRTRSRGTSMAELRSIFFLVTLRAFSVVMIWISQTSMA
jgi:hypothetical protein